MAEIVTVARPYAEAVFQFAQAAGKVAEWSQILACLAQVAQDERVAPLLHDPRISATQMQGLIAVGLTPIQQTLSQALVVTLIENQRLTLLPSIAAQFSALQSQAENAVDAIIASAFPLTLAQKNDLVALLEKHYQAKVNMQETLDPLLIAGVKISVGDDVIDASAQGKLQAMAYSLTS